jgi:pimeloyl-ACP methyl ester carboxylesterase
MRSAKLLPGFVPHDAEIDGVRTTWYEGAPDGPSEEPPVVLVHGLGGSATNWTALAPLLARRRRVLVADLPGHGRSAPLARVRQLTDLADHLATLAEARGFLPGAVVGHSMGGVVALRLAVERPEAVRALVLVDSAGIVSTTTRARRALNVATLVQPAKRVAPFRARVAVSPLLRRAVFGYWGAVDPAALTTESVIGYLEGPAHATGVRAAALALTADEPRADTDRVRCPALVVWGARDRMTPIRDGFEFARRLRAPLRVVPATGHLLPAEAPEACRALLEQFLDRLGEPIQRVPVVSDGRAGGARAS